MNEDSYRQQLPNADLFIILQALLKTPGAFVSGSVLAEQLGVSRPAVHGKLDKLREQGFAVEAVQNRGYRITGEPEVLHPDLLNHYIGALGLDLPVLYFPVIDSTNSEAERQLTNGRKGPFAVVSSCQTMGRGRLGRTWHSASAENLYLTVAFQPHIPVQQLQHFTLWAGIHICRALQSDVPNASLQVKWPNDLLCHGRKFAGMLTEAKVDTDCIRSILFGIGLNVNSNPTQFPADLKKTATSLHAIRGEALQLNQIAAAVAEAALKAYEQSILEKTLENLSRAWVPVDFLFQKKVTAIINGTEVSGTAKGIDTNGALILIDDKKFAHIVYAGDVTLKK